MKAKIISFAVGFGVSLIVATSSFSQMHPNFKNLYNAYPLLVDLKNNATDPGNAPANTSIAVTNKVSRSFSKHFADASDQSWSIAGKNFLNSFYVKGLLTHALFSKNGGLIYIITYGGEKNMPADVRKIVKSEYYDYAITLAVEVKENNRDIWVVHLDSEQELITVRIEDGEMEQVEHFEKSK